MLMKMKVLQWPSQSLDFNLTDMLWCELKQGINAQNLPKVAILKQI